jgi:cytochrome c oxidase assembly protein subunit 11
MSEAPAQPKASNLVAAAGGAALFAATMFGAAYAAVPLYEWFCRVTGFGGTTQVATAAPAEILDRKVEVRFDANVASGLSWRFFSEDTRVDVQLGEVKTIYYRVSNTTDRETTATASFNVTPPQTGLYFHKLQCFCFTEQTLAPGETRDMAVVFFVDPEMNAKRDLDDISTITLSYTFFPTPKAERPVAQVQGTTAGAAATPNRM